MPWTDPGKGVRFSKRVEIEGIEESLLKVKGIDCWQQ
jgi:hypothetical protein